MGKYMIFIYALVAFALILSLIVTEKTINKRDNDKLIYFSNMSICITILLVGYIFEITSVNVETAHLGTIIEYLGLPYVAPFSLLFFMSYYGKNPPKWLKYLLLIFPVIVTLLVATAAHHNLYYADMYFKPGPPAPHIGFTPMPLYYIYFAYNYAILLCDFVLVIYSSIKKPKKQRKSDLLFIPVFILPAISLFLYLTNNTPYNFDFTNIVLSICLCLIGYSVLRSNVLQILPLAREQLLSNMKDAFLVIDSQNRYLDANIAAKQLFPALKGDCFGIELSSISGLDSELFWPKENNSEFSYQIDGVTKTFRTSFTNVYNKEKIVCTCIVFYDITDTNDLIRELNKNATFDNLTGIYNRGALMKMLNLNFQQAKSNNQKMSVMMIDFDLFKNINDEYGHLCGDEVLRSMSHLLKNRLRQGDILGRYGGEEFCTSFLNMDKDGAFSIAEKMRKIIENHIIVFEGNEIKVTVSIGIGLYDSDRHNSVDQLISDADNALYKAKESGRNKTVIYDVHQFVDENVSAIDEQ